MTTKKVIFALIILLAIYCSAMTVFAENAGNTTPAATENDIIPTNRYLESTVAIYFLRFVFNDAGGFWGIFLTAI